MVREQRNVREQRSLAESRKKQEKERKIDELKHQLAAMDYKGQKYLDGEYTTAQWAAIVAQRKTLREQIRTLEAQLET